MTGTQNAVLNRIYRYLINYKADDCRDLSNSNKCEALDRAKRLFNQANVEFGSIQDIINIP